MPALQVRLGDDEYAKVKESAKSAGVSMSEYVRGRLFDGEQPAPEPSKKPLPPRVPVNAEGVISAPARKVPLPPAVRPPLVPATLPPGIPPPPEPDVLDDLPPLEVPEFDYVPGANVPKVTITADSDGLEVGPEVIIDLPPVSKPQAVAWDSPKKSTFKRSKKCTSSRCSPQIGATCDACRKENVITF